MFHWRFSNFRNYKIFIILKIIIIFSSYCGISYECDKCIILVVINKLYKLWLMLKFRKNARYLLNKND